MADSDPFEVTVPITTRDGMNTKTPRIRGWTYHHVLPVRTYFLMASVILRVVVNPGCWRTTRTVGTNALKQMCQYKSNADAIGLFINDKAWAHVAPTDEQFAEVAKLCASPPFGGFGGPNPDQRSDDPHEGMEMNRPLSTDQTWWDSIKSARSILYASLGLHALPPVNTPVTATKPLYDWYALVLSLSGYIDRAASVGQPRFQHDDWMCVGGNIWTAVSKSQIATPNVKGGLMKLRLPGERRTFIDTLDTPAAALQRRNATFLAQKDDFYFLANPQA